MPLSCFLSSSPKNKHRSLLQSYKNVSIVLCALLFSTTGCISFKTEYPKTTYYRLEDRSITPFTKTVSEGLLVKPFTIDSEFNTDRMIVMTNATEAQPLMYHRWTSEPQELITAHLLHRLQQSSFFSGGVFTPASTVTPVLQLEGHITECLARSTPEGNVASVRIHCTIQKADATGKMSVILQKVYSQNIRRANDGAASIAPAMSEAVSTIGDELLADITKTLLP